MVATLISEIKKRAERDCTVSQLSLAYAYLDGDGVHQCPEMALYWFKRRLDTLKKLAGKGDVDANHKVSLAYFKGEGVEKNATKGFEWDDKHKAALGIQVR